MELVGLQEEEEEWCSKVLGVFVALSAYGI